jgi:hypothetical protein
VFTSFRLVKYIDESSIDRRGAPVQGSTGRTDLFFVRSRGLYASRPAGPYRPPNRAPEMLSEDDWARLGHLARSTEALLSGCGMSEVSRPSSRNPTVD